MSVNATVSDVIKLTKLLRQNGDKVLSGSCKLTLSTVLLHHLNEVFPVLATDADDVESCFAVCTNTRINVYRDHYKFLHDFVQKTISLKITHNPGHPVYPIDISKFRQLKYLELQKVCVEYLKGLQAMRGQLECVVCIGCRVVSSLDNFLAKCGGDAGLSFVWSSLIKLSLSYNNLTKLDTSLELTPWLKTLDLSHNLITKADRLECLPNLQCLNLGYNKLETIPYFHRGACQTLQKLVLKNNYINSLEGLEGLENLRELDLAYNCIIDHFVLWPLQTMSTLLWISLEGNPVAYHPSHRTNTIRLLHPAVSNTKFILDRLPLSKTEKRLVSENSIFAIRSVRSACKNNLMNSSINSELATCSINSGSFVDTLSRSQLTESLSNVEDLSASMRRKNLKVAIINDFDNSEDESFMSKSINLASSYKASSEDHLETKRQILALRQKFGENDWLSNQGGTFIQNIMGLPPTDSKFLSCSFKDDTNVSSISETQSTTTLEQFPNQEDSSLEQTEKMNDSFVEHMDNKETVSVTPEPAYDPDEETGDLYTVQRYKTKDSVEEIFLILTNDDITERDPITGKVKCRWATNSVLSCVIGRDESTTVDIHFDTTRRDRQSRRYVAELEDAKNIVLTLTEIIRAKPILLKVFKCMKCSTHFSQDSDDSAVVATFSDNRQPKCPTCQSTLVIQTDELDMSPNNRSVNLTDLTSDDLPNPSLDLTEANLKHSASHSSIGSATSLDDSRESTPASTNVKKYESDIEILSNPSQSSIEVLDDGLRSTPKRKRSSEERRIALAPSLLTIPDSTPVMTGLTESSSSGSLTDSVCTAYENNKISKLSDISESTDVGYNSEDIEKSTTSIGSLSTKFEGLLQSFKTPTEVKKVNRSSEMMRSIQYSYEDFKSVDHRIKLHIILNIFEHENEVLILLLRAEILRQNSKTPFPGILVLSTTKIYVLRIDGNECDEPQTWLCKEVSWTIDRLRSFAPLPFKQGVLVEVELPSKLGEETDNTFILCLLQDFQRTSNLLFYLSDTPIPANCEVECAVPKHCNEGIKSILQCSKYYKETDSVQILAILELAKLQFKNNNTKLQISAVLVTTSAVIILADEMQWLLPNSKTKPKIVTEQGLEYLVDIKVQNKIVDLNFVNNGESDSEEIWTLGFVSSEAANAVSDSIKTPWEKLLSDLTKIQSC